MNWYGILSFLILFCFGKRLNEIHVWDFVIVLCIGRKVQVKQHIGFTKIIFGSFNIFNNNSWVYLNLCKRLSNLQTFIQNVKFKDGQLTIAWFLWDHRKLFIGVQGCYYNTFVEQDFLKTRCSQLLTYLCCYGGSIKNSYSKRLRMAMFCHCHYFHNSVPSK